jgi:hypothetical protein
MIGLVTQRPRSRLDLLEQFVHLGDQACRSPNAILRRSRKRARLAAQQLTLLCARASMTKTVPDILAKTIALIALGFCVGGPALAQPPKTSPYPPPGQLVDVGGYRVHIHCTGAGSPTVVIVGAGFSFDWGLVQPEVAKSTKICTYDVSGTAWSDPGPPLTCAARVDEVHRLLRNAGIKGPYVLAGLSIGALVARLYASLYPGEVAGMVIVDHAFIDLGSEASPGKSAVPSRSGLDSPPVLIHQTPIILTVEDTSHFSNLPERLQRLHRWAESSNRCVRPSRMLRIVCRN